MELATQILKATEKVRLHNCYKIFRFLDRLERQRINLSRRVRYLVDLIRLAALQW
jgi:hypothetical protein